MNVVTPGELAEGGGRRAWAEAGSCQGSVADPICQVKASQVGRVARRIGGEGIPSESCTGRSPNPRKIRGVVPSLSFRFFWSSSAPPFLLPYKSDHFQPVSSTLFIECCCVSLRQEYSGPHFTPGPWLGSLPW